jgi:hypothetical protein
VKIEKAKWRSLAVLAVLLAGMIYAAGKAPLGGPTQSLAGEAATIEISCQEPQGCFLEISKAIKTAPSGATIYIGPGLYYEKPMVIQKSLTLQGTSPDETHIHIIEPGAAFTVDSRDPLTFTLQALSLKTRIWEREFGKDLNIGLLWKQEQEVGEQTTSIQNVEIESDIGILLDGWKGKITIQQSKIYGVSQGLSAEGGDLRINVEDSWFVGPLGPSSIFPASFSFSGINFIGRPGGGHVQGIIKGSSISGWGFAGVAAASLSFRGWGSVTVSLEDNRVEFNHGAAGVYLKGDVEVELLRNEIAFNEGYGVMLLLPSCPLDHPPPEEHNFRGTVQGVENKIYGNEKGGLCPPDYPWPEGFTTP